MLAGRQCHRMIMSEFDYLQDVVQSQPGRKLSLSDCVTSNLLHVEANMCRKLYTIDLKLIWRW